MFQAWEQKMLQEQKMLHMWDLCRWIGSKKCSKRGSGDPESADPSPQLESTQNSSSGQFNLKSFDQWLEDGLHFLFDVTDSKFRDITFFAPSEHILVRLA